jgi:cytochrome c-type biogenesis protein CcmH/NrfF
MRSPSFKKNPGAPSFLHWPEWMREGWRSARLAFWIRAAEATLLAVAVCFSAAAGDSSARMDNLSHRLMCQCGCAQLLGECDHYGCPDRDAELGQLSAGIASGESDQEIFNGFVARYGAVVLAAPTKHGFDLVAWVAPFAVFAAALLGTILLVRRWSGVAGVRAPGAEAARAIQNPADRERRARIRRETGFDTGDEGGF